MVISHSQLRYCIAATLGVFSNGKIAPPACGEQRSPPWLESTMDHLLTVTFATQDGARAALDRLSVDPGAAPLADACVVSRDLRGTVHVAGSQPDAVTGDPFWQLLVGRLGLDGTSDGADATAGLPADFARRVAAALQPGRSAFLALTNGVDIDPLLARMGRHERLIRCDLGDGGGEALRQRIAPSVPEAPLWPQSGFGSFQ